MQIAEDAIVVINGRVDAREETIRMIGSDLTLPDLTKGTDGPVRLPMNQQQCKHAVMENLKEILRAHPGQTPVEIELTFGQQLRPRCPTTRVTPSPGPDGRSSRRCSARRALDRLNCAASRPLSARSAAGAGRNSPRRRRALTRV